jgi:hypothetical protein
MSFVIILRSIIRWFTKICNMGTIYLANILHISLIYSTSIPFNVTIISRPFMLIIIFEYTSNMVVHIHSNYTLINPNTPNYII